MQCSSSFIALHMLNIQYDIYYLHFSNEVLQLSGVLNWGSVFGCTLKWTRMTPLSEKIYLEQRRLLCYVNSHPLMRQGVKSEVVPRWTTEMSSNEQLILQIAAPERSGRKWARRLLATEAQPFRQPRSSLFFLEVVRLHSSKCKYGNSVLFLRVDKSWASWERRQWRCLKSTRWTNTDSNMPFIKDEHFKSLCLLWSIDTTSC